MKVAPETRESKHLFEKVVDNEQVFVVGCRHDEQTFDPMHRPGTRPTGVTPEPYNFDDGDNRDRKDLPMTALLTATLPEYLDDEPVFPGRPQLRLVPAPAQRSLRFRQTATADDQAATDERRRPRRRVSAGVRRRRTLLAMMGLALAILATPLGGFGGVSHTTESTLAAQSQHGAYTVAAGDSLWSIAQRMDPTGDPRPIVAKLAAELGTYQVIPGEQITLP